MNQIIRNALGIGCVFGIVTVKAMPAAFFLLLGKFLLPLYYLLRLKHAREVNSRIACSPFRDRFSIHEYYRMRLYLFINSIKMHSPESFPERVMVKNRDLFAAALASNRPVVLCGLHMGLFEILHKIPWRQTAESGRTFNVLTAPAFSPRLTEYLKKGRQAGGKNLVPNNSLLSAVRRTINGREALGIMLDQSPAREKELLTLWGTIQIPFPQSLLQTMARAGAIIMPVSTWVGARQTVIVKYHDPLNGAGEYHNNSIELFVTIKMFLEQEISRAPEQWNWSYPGIRAGGKPDTTGIQMTNFRREPGAMRGRCADANPCSPSERPRSALHAKAVGHSLSYHFSVVSPP
ncbi:lysophospholipid acyltransferase family protein [Fibrobacterota bacterium]